MCIAMLVLAAALLAFPFVQTLVEVYVYAATMGVAGGMVTVLFFAIWGQRFGPAHLGKIQGAAQMMTVLASAVGPLLLATSKSWTGSYVPLFQYAAAATALLGVAAFFTAVPPLRPTDDLPLDLPRCDPVLVPATDAIQPSSAEPIQRGPL